MNNIYIYLAGPITGQSEQGAVQWRELLSNALEGANENFVGVSPLRCEPPDANGMYPVDYDWELAHSITAKNKLDVARCDAILAYLPGDVPSVGTLLEIGWASGSNKPVILVSNSDSLLNHPLIMADVPFRFDSRKRGWKDAIQAIDGLFGVYT